MKVVLLFGLISLLSDFVYEGARGMMGPYLSLLGASATIVGLVSGVGEFLGYGLRLLSGYLVSRTKRYWSWVIGGYVFSLFSIPALGLVSTWKEALALLLIERIGKAVRTPARDTLLSLAVIPKRSGIAFGIHEALDQLGALLGPLYVSLILYLSASLRICFLSFAIPATLSILCLFYTKRVFGERELLDSSLLVIKDREGLTGNFWVYILGIVLFGAGMPSFYLIGFHLQKKGLSPEIIPLLYALAMGIDALSALLWGWLFDRRGIKILPFVSFFLIVAIPLIIWGNMKLIILGVIFWGIALGAVESIMRSALSLFVPSKKRALGFGLFHFFLGMSFLVGNLLYGFFYERELLRVLYGFVLGLQIASMLSMLWCEKLLRKSL